jgi:[acyl-carrier-protein] S-malonyltransferase
MMKPAAEALALALKKTAIAPPLDTKVVANVSAGYYTSPEDITAGLIGQLVKPVLWQKCMERLLEDGVDVFYEIGPGRVLSGLMRRINRKARITDVSSAETLRGLH